DNPRGRRSLGGLRSEWGRTLEPRSGGGGRSEPDLEATKMKRMLIRSVLILVLASGCLVSGRSLHAQEAPKQGLPSAESILDRDVEAVGGKEAYQKVKTVVITGSFTFQGLKGQFVRAQAAPKQGYLKKNIEGVVTVETVVNGDLAWETNSVSG